MGNRRYWFTTLGELLVNDDAYDRRRIAHARAWLTTLARVITRARGAGRNWPPAASGTIEQRSARLLLAAGTLRGSHRVASRVPWSSWLTLCGNG